MNGSRLSRMCPQTGYDDFDPRDLEDPAENEPRAEVEVEAIPIHCKCGAFCFMGTAADQQPKCCDACQKREWRARA